MTTSGPHDTELPATPELDSSTAREAMTMNPPVNTSSALQLVLADKEPSGPIDTVRDVLREVATRLRRKLDRREDVRDARQRELEQRFGAIDRRRASALDAALRTAEPGVRVDSVITALQRADAERRDAVGATMGRHPLAPWTDDANDSCDIDDLVLVMARPIATREQSLRLPSARVGWDTVSQPCDGDDGDYQQSAGAPAAPGAPAHSDQGPKTVPPKTPEPAPDERARR